MKSHRYEFSLGELANGLGSLLLPVLLIAAALRVAAALGLLPSPWPAFDVEHTILTHQARLSQAPAGADLVLLGDSSCLMNVSGSVLAESCGGTQKVANLGTFMHVGMNGFATILSHRAAAGDRPLNRVVILVHPEMLRGVEPVPQYQAFLSSLYSGEDWCDTSTFHGQLRGLLGLHVFRDRLWSRLPQPLPKEYGRRYGFNRDLYEFMDRQMGCAADPHQYVPARGQGSAECRLAPALEPGCLALRAAVPSGARLAIGLTPVPESFAGPDYARRWEQLLADWSRWMQPDRVLTNLPPTLPDAWFAGPTHLNPDGAARYTVLLIQAMEKTKFR